MSLTISETSTTTSLTFCNKIACTAHDRLLRALKHKRRDAVPAVRGHLVPADVGGDGDWGGAAGQSVSPPTGAVQGHAAYAGPKRPNVRGV